MREDLPTTLLHRLQCEDLNSSLTINVGQIGYLRWILPIQPEVAFLASAQHMAVLLRLGNVA